MKSTEFPLCHSDEEGAVIAGACGSAELRAVEYCTAGWKDGPVLELFTAEDWQSMLEKIGSLKTKNSTSLRLYLANAVCIWDETRTQAAIPDRLCEYAGMKERAFYFEDGAGRKYLRGSAQQH